MFLFDKGEVQEGGGGRIMVGGAYHGIDLFTGYAVRPILEIQTPCLGRPFSLHVAILILCRKSGVRRVHPLLERIPGEAFNL